MDMQLPPHEGDEMSVVDMHTGGEPLRIILSGYPEVRGDSVLSKRRYVREHLDHLRKVLMYEPRGHYDMYGALIVDSELPEADLGVLFMHNEGYGTMCGHAVIALGRFAVDYKLVKEPQSPETQVNIHCPCGLVKAFVEYSDGKTGGVRFHSVPAFAFATGMTLALTFVLTRNQTVSRCFFYMCSINYMTSPDVTVTVEGFGDATVDISYGGAFYAFVNAQRFGLDVNKSRTRDLVDAATAVTNAVKSQVRICIVQLTGNKKICVELLHTVLLMQTEKLAGALCNLKLGRLCGKHFFSNKLCVKILLLFYNWEHIFPGTFYNVAFFQLAIFLIKFSFVVEQVFTNHHYKIHDNIFRGL